MRLGLGVSAVADAAGLAPLASAAEDLGYASLWSNDTPSGDGLAMVQAWAAGSRRTDLAVGVMPLDRRTPESIAESVRSRELPLDRVVLGVGAGFSSDPVGDVRAGIEKLRSLLPGVRLAVAAMGSRMCRLGGQTGDAVLLNWMTPERTEWARDIVHEGAREAGRDPAGVTIYGYVRVAIGPDAGDRLAREASGYQALPHYLRHFHAMGGDPTKVGIAVDDPAQVRARLAEYTALDIPVVRVLSDGSLDSILAVARAAAAA